MGEVRRVVSMRTRACVFCRAERSSSKVEMSSPSSATQRRMWKHDHSRPICVPLETSPKPTVVAVTMQW